MSGAIAGRLRNVLLGGGRGILMLTAAIGVAGVLSPVGGWAGEKPLPDIMAHRGGAGDAPENTLEAIRLSLASGAGAMWLTVQLSKDGVPVLYRPKDLSAQTDRSGSVADHTAAELAGMNAGWHFKGPDGGHPYRERPEGIPALREALRILPPDMPVVLDLKALPAGPVAQAVARLLTEEDAWRRVTLYSTEADYQEAFAAFPEAQVFETRDDTRDRIVKVLMRRECANVPDEPVWAAFELRRQVTVTEKFTLGEGVSRVDALMWTPLTVTCFRKKAPVKIVAIAVNNASDYNLAACLGVNAVLADSPRTMGKIKEDLSGKPLQCSE